MWKTVVAGAAALAIAGSSLVYAQQRDHEGNRDQRWQHHGDHRGNPHAGLTQEDRAAFTDARIAAMKAGLRLKPDQEKNWPAFETALRDIAKTRADAYSARHAMGKGEVAKDESRSDDPVVRMRRQAEMLSTAGANLKKLADAQEPLYASLDDSQKKRFNLLAKVLSGHKKHFAQMRDHRRHEMRGGMRNHEMRGDNSRGPRARGMEDNRDNNTGSAMGERL
jgi:hypothetical protein